MSKQFGHGTEIVKLRSCTNILCSEAFLTKYNIIKIPFNLTKISKLFTKNKRKNCISLKKWATNTTMLGHKIKNHAKIPTNHHMQT